MNDHNPEFFRQEYKAFVTENSPAGTKVAEPRAVDKDDGLNAKIRYAIRFWMEDSTIVIQKWERKMLIGVVFFNFRYSLLGEKAERFLVNTETGDIVTTEPLDRELNAIYHLTLVAQDSSLTEPKASAVNLTIFVQDLNDNAPVFSSPRYTAYVPDTTKAG